MIDRPTLPDLALRYAALRALSETVAVAFDHAKQDLLHGMLALGSEATRATLGGDTVCRVTVVMPSAKPRITDDRAFLAWVQAEHPGEVEVKVRSSFQRAILDAVSVLDDGTTVHNGTGEIIPGVGLGQPGDPYVRGPIKPDDVARIVAAFRTGELPIDLTATPDAPAITP